MHWEENSCKPSMHFLLSWGNKNKNKNIGIPGWSLKYLNQSKALVEPAIVKIRNVSR
jgi:hypothetical protein